MSPIRCPDNPVMLSGYYRNECPDVAEICTFMATNELFEQLSSTFVGITNQEAENRQNEFGKNIITTDNKNTLLHRLREAVINPFNLILLLIAAVT